MIFAPLHGAIELHLLHDCLEYSVHFSRTIIRAELALVRTNESALAHTVQASGLAKLGKAVTTPRLFALVAFERLVKNFLAELANEGVDRRVVGAVEPSH